MPLAGKEPLVTPVIHPDAGGCDVRAAGVRRIGAAVESLELPAPRAPRAGEVLLDVRACGLGNWDEIVRTGGWDTGARPPMALGVEAAGIVTAVGDPAAGISAGDRVTTHSLPLREQGCWAERFIADAEHVAPLPPGVPWDAAGALPVPALTADQALRDAAGVRAGQTVLVHGAGGVTGGLLVQLAAHLGATVIATGSPHSAERIRGLGASEVVDYHQPDWPERVRSLTGGADAAVNAARDGAADAARAVRDGGALATITSDPPDPGRGITVREVYVAPDGPRLRRLAGLLAQGAITVTVGQRYPLEQAAAALDLVRRGAHGTALVLQPAFRPAD
jgi:NADPH:quinone reductase-like Zn-dependent oxidoreductase